MKKIFSLLSLCVLGISMMLVSACGVTYDDISLVPSETAIELAVGEEKTFDVEIKNYNSNISNVLSINNPDNVISIEDTETNKGKTFVTIKGLRVGETILNVRSLEGNKECDITVRVYESIDELVVVGSPYILKTENNHINFESAGFVTFAPVSARGEDITYTYLYMGTEEVVVGAVVDQGILYLINESEDRIQVTSDKISLTASVADGLEIEPKTFDVDILAPIEVGDIQYIKKGLGTTYLAEPQNVTEPIMLISNLSSNCYYEFELQCESDVEIRVTSIKNIASKINVSLQDYTPTSSHSKFFYLQADLVGEDKLTIELYYKNYPAYVKTLTFDVQTTSSPTSIYVNNKTVFNEPITLFDNFAGASGLYTIIPTIYKTDSTFENLKFSVYSSIGENPTPLENWADFIDVKYKNVPMTENFTISSKDFKNNVLSNTIYVYGKEEISRLYIVLEVESELLLDSVVSITIPFEIKKGVETISLDKNYTNGIYLDINGGTKTAKIISYTNSSAYTEGAKVAYLGNANDVVDADIEINTQGKVDLILTPKKIGEATISVVMPNGMLVGVKIFVEQAVAARDVHIQMGDNANNASITEVKETNGNVSSIAMRFLSNDKPENYITALNLDTAGSNLYSISYRVNQQTNVIKFDIETLTFEVFSVGNATIRLSVSLYKIENFQKILLSSTLEYTITVISYSPISEIFFTQDDSEVSKISIYRESDVGYEYAQLGLAKTTFSVDARRSDGTTLGESASFNIRGQYQISSGGAINNFGSYSKNGNDYTLNCNSNFAVAGSSFWLQFSITEYGVTTANVINVNIEKYNPLYSVGFYNYVSDLYLSASNPSYTFQTFMDGEADCQEFDVVFTVNGEENRDLFNIDVATDFSSVEISHNPSAGGGQGVLYFIPVCAYYLDNDRIKFAYSQTINISYGDGSEENPEPISTTEQFATAIMSHPDKHYLITTNLDLSQLSSKFGYVFGKYILSGSIVGANSSIRLLNLNVDEATHDGTENVYGGLFKIVSGKVKNITFEGAINITTRNDYANFIGLLAGQNSGSITNCSFVLYESSINLVAYDHLKNPLIAVGGVVGVNSGVISNTVSNNPDDAISTMVKHVGVQKAIYNGYSKNTRFGGMVGENNGAIVRTIQDKELVLFNDNINSMILNIKTEGFTNVGGIVGVHEFKNLSGEFATSTIKGHLVTGQINAERFAISKDEIYGAENIGGIAGYNNSYIDDIVMRATVKGFDFVGGIAGYDMTVNSYNGTNAEACKKITNCKVQAVKTTTFSPLIMAKTTTSTCVGAISGNETSAINQGVYAETNSATYFYDIDINAKKYPVVYNCVVANVYDSVKFDAEDEYYNLFRKSQAVINIKEISSTAHKLTTAQEFDNKLAMLMFYEAENSSEQRFIEHLNKNLDIPFIFENPDSITISSLTPNILIVNSLGKIELRSTGLATLVVTSILDNTKIDYVYIYVCNAFDAFALGNSVKEPIITSEWNIYVGKPLTLQYFFTHSNIQTVDDYAQTLEVPLKASTSPSIVYTSEAEGYISIKISGNVITFTALPVDGETVTKLVQIMPHFEVDLPNIGSASLEDAQLQQIITGSDFALDLLMSAKKGTSQISTSISDIEVEPIDSIDVIVSQTTDFSGDYLKIYSYKETASQDTNNDYFIIKDFSGYDYDSVNGVYKIKTDANGNTLKGNFSFVFNFEKYILTDYEGTYAIIFEADNGFSKEIRITLETQKVSSLNIKNYYDVTTTYDRTKLQSDYMASGALNMMIVEFYPHFADYDYLYIKNGVENSAKENFMLFELYRLGENNQLEFIKGTTSVSDGIKIPKSIVDSLALNSTLSKLYVLYSTTSKTTIDSQAVIELEVVKTQGETENIVFETQKSVTIIIKDNVAFSLAGRENSELKNYVAKGLTYDLNLNIYGFDETEMVVEATYGNFTHTLNPFDGQIDTGSPIDIVYENGSYNLVVNSDIVYQSSDEGLEIQIASYGKSMSDNLVYTSGKSYLDIVVVDMVVLTDNIRPFVQGGSENIDEFNANTVVAGTQNAVLNLSVGNRHTLATSLQNGVTVEYDLTNERTSEYVKKFEKSLSNNAVWKVKADLLGVVGKYVREVTLDQNTNITTDYFKITGSLVGENKNINYVPLKITDYENPMYYFDFQAKFKYTNGIPVFASLDDEFAFDLSTNFVPDIYPNSTEENAIPVTTYEELLEMERGGHYIMLNDIQLPETHTPLTTQASSLDGNGYALILPSVLTFEQEDNIGIFATIEEETILKNLTIKIPSQTKITLTTTEAINFGLLAGRNFGSITNCAIECSDYVQVTISLPNQTTDTSSNNVAGFVATNSGAITNSRVKLNISAIANLSGFVCENEGKIASSYVKNSLLANSGSAHYHKTAGFVIKNGYSANNQTAQIMSCYVLGDTTMQGVYSTSKLYYINSNPNASGFVYENNSLIKDCFSDIYINSSATRTGFVLSNSGEIVNAYATCSFNENNGRNTHAFVCNNYTGDSQSKNYGKLNSCFYLNIADNAETQGLTGLTANKFADKSVFENFIFSSNINKTEGIWFYPASGNELFFTIDGNSQVFTPNKPQLVSANIITSSQRAQDPDLTTIDTETGETIYVYYETKSESGSTYNPILISSADAFESIMLQNSSGNVNSKTYRLISDLVFEETSNITSLSKLIFTGVLEGNGLSLSGFTINSKETSKNGGLFAQIGQGYSNNGVVKNLTLAPKYLNFPNTQNVGALAGLLEGGKIYNVVADGFKNSSSGGVAIYGFNNVGGVIGVACNDFQIIDVASSVSAKATYDHIKAAKPLGEFTNASQSSNCSYAGSVLGVGYGGGEIKGIEATNNVRASAEIAGLLIGRVGKGVTVESISQEIAAGQYLNATAYGGIVAGENSGVVKNVVINGAAQTDFFNITDTQNLPIAVGGIVGLQTAGTLQNISLDLDFNWSLISPSVVGGIAGEVLSGSLSDIDYSGTISIKAETNVGAISKVIVGGIVGQILDTQSTTMTKNNFGGMVSLKNIITEGEIEVDSINILKTITGGIVGKVVNDYNKNETASTMTTKNKHIFNNVHNDMDISLNAIIYNGTLDSYTGGLVGAVFADIQENYAGELYVLDTDNDSKTMLQSTSNANLDLNIQDMKGSASTNLYYGGILGFGYTVDAYAIVDINDSNRNIPWGVILGNEAKSLTNPVYLGMFYEEEGNKIYYASMEESGVLTINSNSQTQKFENN